MDRTIRVFRTEGNIFEHKFQDVVNLNHWKVRWRPRIVLSCR